MVLDNSSTRLVRGACRTAAVALGSFLGCLTLNSLELPESFRARLPLIWLCLVAVGFLALAGPLWERFRGRPERSVFISRSAQALLVLLGIFLAVLLLDDGQIKRFFTPPKREMPVPVRIVVTSGDPVIRRGDAVTLTAYREGTPTEPVEFVSRSASGLTRTQVEADERGIYAVTLESVEEDFEYHFAWGVLTTESHRVVTATPIAILPGTRIHVTPPDYLAGRVSSQTLEGVRELTCAEFSRVKLEIPLSAVPVSAVLESVGRSGEVAILPMLQQQGGKLRIAEIVLTEDVRLTLTVTGERGIQSEAKFHFSVRPDAPPRWKQISRLCTEEWEVGPDDSLELLMAAEDDWGTLTAEVEIVHEKGKTSRQPVAVPGKVHLRFQEFAKVGDRLKVRVVLRDGRQVKTPPRAPQTITWPEGGWASFRMVEKCPPVEETRVAWEGKMTMQAVEFASSQLLHALNECDPKAPENELDARERIARSDLAAARERLAQLAKETQFSPHPGTAFQQLTSLISSLEALEKNRRLLTARDKIQEALQQLSQLQKEERRHTALLLGRVRLRALAENPEFHSGLLVQLVKGIPELQQEVDAAMISERGTLIRQAHELASALRALDAAIRQTEEAIRLQQAEGLARAQRERDDQCLQFAALSSLPAVIAKASPLSLEPQRRASAALRAGEFVEACAATEQMAREFDRLAEELATAQRREPRATGRQTTSLLQEWKRRYTDRIANDPAAISRQQLGVKIPSLLEVVDRTPDESPESLERRNRLVSRLREVDAALTKAPPLETLEAFQKAIDESTAWTESLPEGRVWRSERLRRYLVLRKRYDLWEQSLSRGARPQEFLKEGRKLAEEVAKLPFPDLVERCAILERAIQLAAEDGSHPESAISLARARLAWDRLKQNLQEQEADDERAEQIIQSVTSLIPLVASSDGSLFEQLSPKIASLRQLLTEKKSATAEMRTLGEELEHLVKTNAPRAALIATLGRLEAAARRHLLGLSDGTSESQRLSFLLDDLRKIDTEERNDIERRQRLAMIADKLASLRLPAVRDDQRKLVSSLREGILPKTIDLETKLSPESHLPLAGPFPAPMSAIQEQEFHAREAGFPSQRLAFLARRLAALQRSGRNEIARAAAAMTQSLKVEEDSLGELLTEQRAIAESLRSHSPEPLIVLEQARTLRLMETTIRALRDGQLNSAIPLTTEVETALKACFMTAQRDTHFLGELRARQLVLNAQLAKWQGDRLAEVGRQNACQKEWRESLTRLHTEVIRRRQGSFSASLEGLGEILQNALELEEEAARAKKSASSEATVKRLAVVEILERLTQEDTITSGAGSLLRDADQEFRAGHIAEGRKRLLEAADQLGR